MSGAIKAYTPGLDAMAAKQSAQSQASTTGLDAMGAKQAEPVRPSTPGLDAMKAREQNGMSLAQELAAKEQVKDRDETEKLKSRKTKSEGLRNERRLARGLRQAEITGRVSDFVRDWALQNAAVQKSVNAQGQTVNTVALPGVGMMDAATGGIIVGPLFTPPTSDVSVPNKSEPAKCIGLGLEVRFVDGSDPPTYEIWVNPGTINGDLPPDMDSVDGKSVASSGSGDVWAEVEVDQETGEVTSVDVKSGSATPENTSTEFHYTLGNYNYPESGRPTVVNYGCGSVEVLVCRNWFAREAPFYGVNLTRCGCGGSGASQ